MANLVKSRPPKRALRGPSLSVAAIRTIGASSPAITTKRGGARRVPIGVPRPAGALLSPGSPTMVPTPTRRRSKGY